MYDAQELASLRRDYVQGFLPQSATRLSASETLSTLGGAGEAFSPARKRVPCRVREIGEEVEVQVAGQTQTQAQVKIEFSVDTPVFSQDRWLIDGVVYDVIGTDSGRAEALSLVAHCVRIGQGDR